MLTTAIETPCQFGRPQFMPIGKGPTHRIVPIEAARHEPREALVSKTIGGKRVHLCLQCVGTEARKEVKN